ncbi:MAG TPA: FlgD immunoglobulin-like domain containing protein [Candidatus Krumholzibacteria bacterium]|nr:FlgD immunoglobulin-like domain containing protein [Candidatus Krumholzibacteria bacterium]HRY42044.1 FlgD immunoglobulin-like domain containing protein [Candidatus Krumholzibacteria bacterium]
MALDHGLNSSVFALASYDGNMIAGGDFWKQGGGGGPHYNYIASWNGLQWEALANGLGHAVDGGVYALVVSGNDLIAGGTFDLSQGENVAKWDGYSWSALGTELVHRVSALAIWDGQIVAGGDFDHGIDPSIRGAAYWDGVHWNALGADVSGEIYTLTASNHGLYGGGDFEAAGNVFARHIARWICQLSPIGVTLDYGDDTISHALDMTVRCVPNPFNPSTTIVYEVPTATSVGLQVFDLRGRLVRTLVDDSVIAGRHEVQWDGRDSNGRELPSGVYFSRLEATGQIAHGRITLVR